MLEQGVSTVISKLKLWNGLHTGNSKKMWALQSEKEDPMKD